VGYSADDLIAAAKRRGCIPTAQATFAIADFLAQADEEIRSYLLPLIRRVQEDYYLQTADFPVSAAVDQVGTIAGAQYRIPYRAVGGTLRELYFLNAAGSPVDVPRISVDDLAGASFGVYFLGNTIQFVNRANISVATLRMVYYLRPSALVLASSAAQVQSVNAAAKQVTLASVPTGYAGNATWDLLRGRPGFEMLGFDLAGTLSGSTITFAATLPGDLAAGDYVCLPEQSPVPQVPAELHPLLAERLAGSFLKSQSDREGWQDSKAEQARLETDAMLLLSQRLAGAPKKIVPRNGLWRR
jgi:hypothetical protein